MAQPVRSVVMSWTGAAPIAAAVALVLALFWGGTLPVVVVVVLSVLLAAAVLAAVYHAEVVAHRVGEPFGSLILAVAVTAIEVGLIITLMIGGGEGATSLARDTVFAAVMITCNGIAGLCLLVGSLRRGVAVFNPRGVSATLATVATLTTLSLVFPRFTTTEAGPEFSTSQLTYAAVASLVLYGLYVGVQTIRHREYFLPVTREGDVFDPREEDEQPEQPATRSALASLGLLLVALVAVVGNAKLISPAVGAGVEAAGLPHSVVGVVIALLVLMPETLAAVRAAARDRIQTSLNLAYGSAMASIGLTIPAIAVASIWLPGPLVLGLEATEMVLLGLTVVVGILTVARGRAIPLHGTVQLTVCGAFLLFAASP